jgi:hypothetical protein
MQAVISGQTMPVLTKGVVLYKGKLTTENSDITPGTAIYASQSGWGELSTESSSLGGAVVPAKVATALGSVDSQDYVLLKVEL